MAANAQVNIAIEIFGFCFCLLLLLSIMMSADIKERLSRTFLKICTLNAALLMFDCFSWLLEGRAEPWVHNALVLTNFFVYISAYLTALALNEYIIAYLRIRITASDKSTHFLRAVYMSGILLVIVSQFNGMLYYISEDNHFYRGEIGWLAFLIPFISYFVNLGVILYYIRSLSVSDAIALLSFWFLPSMAVIVQFFLPGIMLSYVAITFSLLIVYIRIQAEQSRRVRQRETETRIDIMLSQIQPHFLYNSLNTIQNMIEKDPAQAEKLVEQFASYLRENMDSLRQRELIPFPREMKHIETYLYIEKMRFRERLNIKYNLETTDFMLPILTIQPIVENAVRYGVTKKQEGGTVEISTRLVDRGVEITISDDGAGFDINANASDGKSHIGIENARERLSSQCGGTLTIKSELSKGTVATIFIPDERDVKYARHNRR